MHDKNEDEERERQKRERESLSPIDRLHGAPPRTTASGFKDMRSTKRTGRVVQLPLRLHPRVKAIIDAIMERDKPPSLVALFEEMVDAYLDRHGPIDESKLPSEEVLIRRIEEERDKRDGVNAGEILQRLAGEKVQQLRRKQEGPRYRGPSCFSALNPWGRFPSALTWPVGTVAWSAPA